MKASIKEALTLSHLPAGLAVYDSLAVYRPSRRLNELMLGPENRGAINEY